MWHGYKVDPDNRNVAAELERRWEAAACCTDIVEANQPLKMRTIRI
jgi:hypothetical protein